MLLNIEGAHVNTLVFIAVAKIPKECHLKGETFALARTSKISVHSPVDSCSWNSTRQNARAGSM